MSELKNEFNEIGYSFNLVYQGIFIDSEERMLIISKTDFFDEYIEDIDFLNLWFVETDDLVVVDNMISNKELEPYMTKEEILNIIKKELKIGGNNDL